MKRKQGILALFLAGVLTLAACGGQSGGSPSTSDADRTEVPAKALTPQQAYEKMQSGEKLVILDVRTAEEYAAAHIPGAILLPNEEIIVGTRPAQLPILDTETLIYCRSGNRSAQAAEKLGKMGYTNVYDFGGIGDWPYETESGAWQAAAKQGTLQSFSSFDLAGVPVDESVLAGHTLTMVNVWGTFCSPCLNEMPELGKLAQEYADKGVQILGIVVDISQSADGTFDLAQVQSARNLALETGANYRHLLPTADLIQAYLSRVSAVPDTIFLDAQGNQVGESCSGARSGEKWAALIDSLLSEAAK